MRMRLVSISGVVVFVVGYWLLAIGNGILAIGYGRLAMGIINQHKNNKQYEKDILLGGTMPDKCSPHTTTGQEL